MSTAHKLKKYLKTNGATDYVTLLQRLDVRPATLNKAIFELGDELAEVDAGVIVKLKLK